MAQRKFKKHSQSSGDVEDKNNKVKCTGFNKMNLTFILILG